MAEEKETQTVESEEQETTEFGDSQKTTETEETQEETQESSTEETESSDKLEEAVEGAEDSEAEEAPEKKSPVQKRIDRLTAEKYQAIEEKARLEEKVKALESKSEKKEKFYSSAELDQAERKAITDNDIALMGDVNKERLRNLERNLVSRYEQEKEKSQQAQSAQGAEWNKIVSRWSDDEDTDLDIRNKESQLFRIAKQYFEDPEMKAEYSGPGGMERAVADAFKYLILAKRNKKSPKVKKLERKVAKERSKTQLSTGSSGKEAKTSKPQSNDDYFKEYVKDHKARQQKALGV